MATFKILTGAALKNAISGFGKKSSTYAELTHQLSYSALNHVELHHDAIYVTSLFEATPVNYRSAIVRWAVNFGSVTFDAKTTAFTYKKGKASDMDGAMKVSPADFVKSEKKAETAFDEIKQLEAVIARFTEKGASKKMVKALQGALRVVKGESVPENVVTASTLIKARKAKSAPKGKAAPKAEKVAAAA